MLFVCFFRFVAGGLPLQPNGKAAVLWLQDHGGVCCLKAALRDFDRIGALFMAEFQSVPADGNRIVSASEFQRQFRRVLRGNPFSLKVRVQVAPSAAETVTVNVPAASSCASEMLSTVPAKLHAQFFSGVMQRRRFIHKKLPLRSSASAWETVTRLPGVPVTVISAYPARFCP